jgi:hypothetical protein
MFLHLLLQFLYFLFLGVHFLYQSCILFLYLSIRILKYFVNLVDFSNICTLLFFLYWFFHIALLHSRGTLNMPIVCSQEILLIIFNPTAVLSQTQLFMTIHALFHSNIDFLSQSNERAFCYFISN